MRKQLLFILTIFGVFSGCRKDEETVVSFEGQYQTGNTIITYPIEMYTSQGQITNTKIIEKYLNYLRSKRISTDYSLTTSTEALRDTFGVFGKYPIYFSPNAPLLVDFKENNSVSIIANGGSLSITGLVESKTSSRLIIADTVAFQGYPYNNSNPCDQLIKRVRQFPDAACIPVTSCPKLHHKFPFVVRKSQLFLPILNWTISHNTRLLTPNWLSCFQSVGHDWNQFDSSIAQSLAVSDTVLIQAMEIALTKNNYGSKKSNYS